MSFTPYNAPLLSGLLGDMEIAAHFSVQADIKAMLEFEKSLAVAQAAYGLILEENAEAIRLACERFEPDMPLLQQGVVRDGMAVPEFVRQLQEACGETAGEYLHLGSTSQDVVDTSLCTRLVAVNEFLSSRLKEVIGSINDLQKAYGERELMARTRMQAALPVKVSDRLQLWRRPLERRLEMFDEIKRHLHVVQLGGPVGTLSAMGETGSEVRRKLAELLNLNDPGECWHTDRTRLSDYCNWLSAICAALGKIGQDIVLMAQNGLDELAFDQAGGSSAMAHKQNPVKAEVLVANARFAATLNSGIQHNAVHEQERSGSAWTFEWMIVPQLCVVTGASLRNAHLLLKSVKNIAG
ncbi:MAG: 3-carboxy-cis,cis-muconate cycloisomerase [Pseudomonadota bacterium]